MNKRKRDNNEIEETDLLFENDEKRNVTQLFQPQQKIQNGSHLKGIDQYNQMYKESIENPQSFWKKV